MRDGEGAQDRHLRSLAEPRFNGTNGLGLKLRRWLPTRGLHQNLSDYPPTEQKDVVGPKLHWALAVEARESDAEADRPLRGLKRQGLCGHVSHLA